MPRSMGSYKSYVPEVFLALGLLCSDLGDDADAALYRHLDREGGVRQQPLSES